MHRDAEFFAAEMRDQACLTEICAEDFRGGFENKITGRMSPRIIYIFKKIDIKQSDGNKNISAFRVLVKSVGNLKKGAPVIQTGKKILVGQALYRFFYSSSSVMSWIATIAIGFP